MSAATATAAADHRDAELAERHRWGDRAAFDEVYSQHAEMVYNLALRLAGDREEAADLTQEIFLRVFRHLGRFRGGSTLKTWIYRVAINHCRSRLGRRRVPTRPLDDETAGDRLEPADPRRDPEQRAMAGDAGRRVAGALRLLPPVFREAVVLRDLEGLAYGEIAEVLGVRLGTVRSRLARGRDQLRQILESSR
jgi:RNA polymerase sigma-70 factor (ECF subfamily)